MPSPVLSSSEIAIVYSGFAVIFIVLLIGFTRELIKEIKR